MDPREPRVEPRRRVGGRANSAKGTGVQRAEDREKTKGLERLGANAGGLTACDAASGYMVPGLFPDPLPMPGCRPDFDYAAFDPEDNWGDGTVAPYGAGMALMFSPQEALAALRHYRSLTDESGRPLVWRDPRAALAVTGFMDSFNLGTMWVAPEQVAIDQGPLMLSIENARTGFLWERFHSHQFVRGGMDRLGLARDR